MLKIKKSFRCFVMPIFLLLFIGGCGDENNTPNSSMVQLREDVKVIQEPTKEIIGKEINQNSKDLIISQKTAKTLNKGEIFYLPADEDSRFPFGFSGRVKNITSLSSGGSKIEFSEVGIFDIMEKSKQEKIDVALNEENFIGVIAPSFVKSGLTEKEKLLKKSSKSFLDGGVQFVSKKSSSKKEKSFLGDDDTTISFGDIELNLEMNLKEIFSHATSINPVENTADAKLKISGLLSNLFLTEEHDWNIDIFDKENNYFEFNSAINGKMKAEAKLYGNFETTFGFDNQTWREVEKDTFKKFGIKLDIRGLNSDDKKGLIPIIGFVFRIPTPKYSTVYSMYGGGRTQTPVRSAKHGGAIVWVYVNFKGELSLDGELGVATNIKNFKVGINKQKNKKFKLIQEVIASPSSKLLEAPFLKGEAKLETTIGLSIASDIFYGGVRISNASFDFMLKQKESLNSEKRVSYGTDNFGLPWKWNEGNICFNNRGGGGFIFNAKANFRLSGEIFTKDINFNMNWKKQYPSQKDIDKTNNGWVKHLWYVSRADEKCINTEEEKINIVIDSNNSIMWQDNEEAKKLRLSWFSNPDVSTADCTTEGREAECEEYLRPIALTYCKNLLLGGYSNWRLPSENELIETIGKDMFSNFTNNSRYWTQGASAVYFGEEIGEHIDLSEGYVHIRCVRDISNYNETTVDDKSLKALPTNQTIIMSKRTGDWDIFKVGLDGKYLYNITNNPAKDTLPNLTTDRKTILFVSDRNESDREIYSMDIDGKIVNRLTESVGDDITPKASHNGEKIVFVSKRNGTYKLYTMNMDGTNQTRLAEEENNKKEHSPSWSPDDNQIVFVSERDGNEEIHIIDATGETQLNLTQNKAKDEMPQFSPDGTQISFLSDRDGDFDLWIMGIDGTNPHRITGDGKDKVGWYSWSPDGSRILYDSKVDGDYEIYSVNPDGSDLKQLTNNDFDDRYASWSWIGDKIFFTTNRDGNAEIYSMDADGKNPVNMSNDPSDEILPATSTVHGKPICFIATASYGSYLSSEVIVLREFRDDYLLTNDIGRAFVEFYYKYSPPIANYIAEHSLLRSLVRLCLTPIVYGIKYWYITVMLFVWLLFRRKFNPILRNNLKKENYEF